MYVESHSTRRSMRSSARRSSAVHLEVGTCAHHTCAPRGGVVLAIPFSVSVYRPTRSRGPAADTTRSVEDKAFVVLVLVVSVAFVAILLPFSGAILWGTILAVVFAPLNRRLRAAIGHRRTVAAAVTLLIVLASVILPLMLVGGLLANEAADVYARMRSGELDFGRYFEQIVGALPVWAVRILDRFELTNLATLRGRISGVLMQGSQFFAVRALSIGQSTLGLLISFFVMLYLLFFLLRDGDALIRRVRKAVPLRPEQQHALLQRFTLVIRATVKGSLVVAVVQGALGGLILWLLGIRSPMLWALVMGVTSLLPAVGPVLVWLPVALYLLSIGAVWQGVVLIAYGVLVIGLVDNVLRPRLVGKDTEMPDYLVLVATLGGIALLGVNGFIIGPIIAALFMAVWDIVADARAASAG
jgi:predicted PurR-regulated permease PerM